MLVLVGFTQRLKSLPGMHFSCLHRIECYFSLFVAVNNEYSVRPDDIILGIAKGKNSLWS